jgi:hypothetical protein
MRKICLGLVLALAALPASIAEAWAQNAAPPPMAGYTNPKPDFTDIHMERMVDRPAQLVWSRVGGYCQIEAWFGSKCVYTTGNGDIGTNRQLNGTINELMVAKTPLSYAYSQPLSPVYYHGNLSVEVVDATHSRIVYDLLYDTAGMTPEAKTADMAKRRQRFEAGIDKMVQIADAP